MNDIAETIYYKDHIIEIYYDTYAESPREFWDHMGVWLTTKLNETDLKPREIVYSEPSVREQIEEYEGDTVVALLDVYCYDHSGERYNTRGFSCPWDSGQVGWIYATKSAVEKWMGSNYTQENVEEVLRCEVKEIDDWCMGNVFGFRIFTEEEPDEEIDSCWGYYGDKQYVIDEAKGIVDAIHKRIMSAPATRAPAIELLGA